MVTDKLHNLNYRLQVVPDANRAVNLNAQWTDSLLLNKNVVITLNQNL